MSYSPAVNSVAWRAIAHLETLPRGAELMTSALAEAIGCDGKKIVPSLEAALASGLVFRRQRDNHVRSPMWWSLVDHGARPKVDIRRPAVPVANGHAELHVPTFKDANAGDARQHSGSEAAQSPHDDSTGPVAASTPTNGRPPARNGHAEPEGAAAIAGRAERPKETTQRGAVQAHAPSCAARAGDDAKPAVGAAAPEGFRCALWSNGTLQIERSTVAGAAELVLLSREETRQLVAYLDSICLDVVRGEDDAC